MNKKFKNTTRVNPHKGILKFGFRENHKEPNKSTVVAFRESKKHEENVTDEFFKCMLDILIRNNRQVQIFAKDLDQPITIKLEVK